MGVYIDLLEKVVDLIEASRFPKRRTASTGATKGSEKGFIHSFDRKTDVSHNPFSHASSIGPGPRGRERGETGQWDCRKRGKYVQVCTNTETGRKITVRVKPGWKKAYNAEYRKRKFPRQIGGKALMNPKTAKQIDEPQEPKTPPLKTGEKIPKRKSPAVKRQKLAHLKQKMAGAASTEKKARRRGGGRKRGKQAAGKQATLPMESLSVRDQLLLERKAAKQPKYWMKGLKLQRGALKKRYGLKPHQTIPDAVWTRIDADLKQLQQKAAKGKLKTDEMKHLKQIVLAKTFRRVSHARQEEDQQHQDQITLNDDTLRLLTVLREVLS